MSEQMTWEADREMMPRTNFLAQRAALTGISGGRSAQGTRFLQPATSRSALTLVELIVSMMIFALVAALVSTIIISSASMTSRTLSKEHTRLIASAELDFIAGRLWMADSINLSTVPPGSTWDIDAVPFGSEALYIGTTVAPAGTSAEPYHVGYLWYKRARDTSSRNIFGISFYRDLTSRLRIEVLNNSRRGTRPASGSLLALGGPTVTISIELLNTDGTVVETYSKSLELLNSEPISQNTGNAIGALVVPGTVLPPEGNALVVELTHQKPPTS